MCASSYFPWVGEFTEEAWGCAAHYNNIFDSDSTDSLDVEAWFDGYNRAVGERGDRETWRFVNFKSKSVSDPMKETVPSALFDFGRITLVLEPVAKLALDFFAVGASTGLAEDTLLALNNGIAEVAKFFGGLAFDHGSGDIAEVTRLWVTGKDVEDDGLMSAKGTVAAFVGVASLLAA